MLDREVYCRWCVVGVEQVSKGERCTVNGAWLGREESSSVKEKGTELGFVGGDLVWIASCKRREK